MLLLSCTSFIYSMNNEYVPRIYMEQARATMFDQVPQAKTEQGLKLAYGYYVQLLYRHEMVPELTFMEADSFCNNARVVYPEITGMIKRFYNCVIEKAFSVPEKSTAVAQALNAAAASGLDRSYILRGHRKSPLDEDKFTKKINRMNEIIKIVKTLPGLIDSESESD